MQVRKGEITSVFKNRAEVLTSEGIRYKLVLRNARILTAVDGQLQWKQYSLKEKPTSFEVGQQITFEILPHWPDHGGYWTTTEQFDKIVESVYH